MSVKSITGESFEAWRFDRFRDALADSAHDLCSRGLQAGNHDFHNTSFFRPVFDYVALARGEVAVKVAKLVRQQSNACSAAQEAIGVDSEVELE